jgi:predicted nucleotide-binding protein (sugar kinase/HSP70/actin superfamily)
VSDSFFLIGGLLLAGILFAQSLAILLIMQRLRRLHLLRQLENEAVLKAMQALEGQNRDLREKQQLLLAHQHKLQLDLVSLRPRRPEPETAQTEPASPKVLH